MNPMLAAFINESRELLQVASKCFLELEKSPGDQEILNELFRAVHTIKGASGIFEISPLTKVVHAGEDILDRVKVGEMTLTPEHVDLFLDAFDQVSQWIDDLEDEEELPDNAAAISADLTKQLRILLGADDNLPEVSKTQETENEGSRQQYETLPDWINGLSTAQKIHILQALKNTTAETDATHVFTAGQYLPDSDCFFTGQDPLQEVEQMPQQAWIDVGINEPWPENSEEFDPFHCNLRFYFTAAHGKESTYKHFYHVVESVTASEHHWLQLIDLQGEMLPQEPFQSFLNDAEKFSTSEDWLSLQKLCNEFLGLIKQSGYQVEAMHWLSELLDTSLASPQVVNLFLKSIEGHKIQSQDLEACYLGEINQSDHTTTDDTVTSSISENSDSQTDSSDSLQRAAEIHEIKPKTLQVDNSEEAEIVLSILETQLHVLATTTDQDIWKGRLRSITNTAQRLLKNLIVSVSNTEFDNALEKSLQETSAEPLKQILQSVISELKVDVAQQGPNSSLKKSKEISEATSDDKMRLDNVGNTNERRQQKAKFLKVDQTRIDALMDLVGELVVAKNALPFLARRAENTFNSKELSREIRAQHAVINRIAEDMQSAVMAVRMVPVGTVFQRFPRLVRDLSRKLNKNIQLELVGEETEVDKTVIEDLSDPLIHIVRNSIDHGIEQEAVRAAAGKPAMATIRLQATQLDDQVVIEIQDDGKGINPQIIKRKAFEKGVINEERLESITDKEAIQLIFEAGFSTAEQVSDLSGRGVGMDVVRTTIANAGGTVSVDSEVGKNTNIRMALPLSMAITQVMMIRCAGQSYGVAFESIVETVRISDKVLTRIKNQSAIVLRGRIIPCFELHELLEIPALERKTEELAVLVVQVGGEEVGILIDDFEEGIDVILKPLEGIMAGYRQYSGTALLGDGRVLMVLNLKELLECQ
ncbi:MAG: chemotaxis protein CheA [Pseudomonadota bacterium]